MSATLARIEQLARPTRRLVVVAGLAGYPVAFGALALLRRAGLDRWLVLSVFLVLVLGTLAALWVGYAYARGRVDGRRSDIDERDLQLRQEAYALSHRVLATTLALATAAVEVYLTSGHAIRLDAAGFLPVLVWVVVYIPALPTLMLAWIEPNPVVDA